MGDTWILSHGCSSTVWISLILHTDIKTCPIFTSTPKADTRLWQQHWPRSSCQLVTETPFSFQDRQLWPGLYVVVLQMDFLVQQSIMTIKWLLSCLCSHTSLISIKTSYTVRIVKVFPGFWWKHRETLGPLLLPMRPVYKHLHQGQWFQNQTGLNYAEIGLFLYTLRCQIFMRMLCDVWSNALLKCLQVYNSV